MAVEVVGQWVHTDPAAELALKQAAENDSTPAVRKKVSWYIPGGTIHHKTRSPTKNVHGVRR